MEVGGGKGNNRGPMAPTIINLKLLFLNSLVHPGQSGNPAPGRYYRSGEVFRILIKI